MDLDKIETFDKDYTDVILWRSMEKTPTYEKFYNKCIRLGGKQVCFPYIQIEKGRVEVSAKIEDRGWVIDNFDYSWEIWKPHRRKVWKLTKEIANHYPLVRS